MFDSVDPKQSFPALERGILKYWQEENTFKRSISHRCTKDCAPGQRKSKERSDFSFYDGPPFATGLPHYGHLLAGTIKDVIPRYRTMRGDRVQRRFGWDCHGLPVEYEIEKEHGIQSRKDIEKMGVAAFNKLCRAAVQRYTKEWRVTVERMGRWVDMDWDYRTMDPDYMESIWWVFSQLYEKGLISEGYKGMYICPRCATPLANFEVTQGYADRKDLSVIVTFPLKDDPDTVILAWTTTPWSLPGNLWLAVGKHIEYAKVKADGKTYILAKKLIEKVFKGRDYEIVGAIKPQELAGMKYEPLFPYFVDTVLPSTLKSGKPLTYGERENRVVMSDAVEVSDEEGTGIVHITSSTGEDSYAVAKSQGTDVLYHVTIEGFFVPAVTDFAGLHVKPEGKDPMATDKKVLENLKQRGRFFSQQVITHSYPHCWRCDTPLIPYTTASWFVSVEKIKDAMLQVNAETEWVPEHLRDGRFGKWLEGARDWAISRNRYWGTPLPIWRCEETGEIEVMGSRDDLMKRVPQRFTKVTVLRHGQSAGNIKPIYQGELPGTDLSDAGKAQAKESGQFLADQDVAAIYASPLARTQQTAAIIAEETEAPVSIDDRLREVSFGEYEGKHVDFSDLSFQKARRAHKLTSNQIESVYHFPGMETWPAVQERVTAFLGEILPKHRGEHVVIVTHADPLLNIKHFFTREDPAKLYEQPYPEFADTETFYWDHETQAQMDLHKETVDGITWPCDGSKKEVTVTFVRHGQTDWNKEGKLQGQADIPLNETGKHQAEELAKQLRGQPFDAVLSSDLKRAVDTAEIIAHELGLPKPSRWELLRERNQGEWDGRPWEDVRSQFNLSPTVSLNSHPGTPPGGESLQQFLERGTLVAKKIRNTFPGKRILVVTHTGMVGSMRASVEHLPIDQAFQRLGNAGTYQVTLQPRFEHIPDVLDCWFESGSMPYAQSHFPFDREHVRAIGDKRLAISGNSASAQRLPLSAFRSSSPSLLPPGFPADFIAEGIDQTRGWFYTLTVLSAALFNRPAFRHCIVNGTVLAEDGKKMSKRLKNYPEPLVVVEKHGADAVRFALMSSPAVRGEDLRFSEKTVEESLRNVLLPLWNAYAFFVTYANASGWLPRDIREHSSHPLDRWIRAEVQDLVNRMTAELDRYDLSATCAELHDTIDALTNWYVRLSRRRFAGKAGLHAEELAGAEGEEDQEAALTTLYDVLLTISQLLAPFCPFITDAIYLNLVPEKHGSVHLTDWPEPRALSKEEERLLAKTRVLRTVVSLGLTVRAEKKIKLRQPLASAVIAIPPTMLGESLGDEEISLLQEELNVKEIEVIADPGSLAQAVAMVDARKVGPRLGARVQEIIAAGKRGEFTVAPDGSILIGDERLAPDEARIVYVGKKGQDACGELRRTVAADRGIVVSINTTLSQELSIEGCGRDLIRAIQRERKEAGLAIGDRIRLTLENADDIVASCGGQIVKETNAVLEKDAKGDSHEVPLDGRIISFRFERL